MGRFDNLLATIDANIRENGDNEITGKVLNTTLHDMVDATDAELAELSAEVGRKQDTITDLETIRSGAAKGATAIQEVKTINGRSIVGVGNIDIQSDIDASLEPLQIQLDSHDVAIEDLQDNKVDKGDYAPALTAGFADNLVSKDIVADSEFNVRRSGGGAISDGVARMEVVKGKSVVWNQKNDKNVSLASGDNTSGTSPMYLTIGSEHHYNECISHKIFAKATSSDANVDKVYYTDDVQMNLLEGAFFVAQSAASVIGIIARIPVGGKVDNAQIDVDFYDLTQMFGVGNEPTTIEEFYARILQNVDDHAYNEGEVIHCNVDAVKSVGRNVWDEEWELGAIGADGILDATTTRRTTSYIRILPNQEYYLAGPSTMGYGRYAYYDIDKKVVKAEIESGFLANIQFTTPPDAAYLRITLGVAYGTTYNHDICVNLSDPDFNGQYEPYKEDVRELPSAIKEVFPNGMMSAGTAHDVAYNDLNKEVGVTEKRIGVVDMGDLNWSLFEGSETFMYTLNTAAFYRGQQLLCAKTFDRIETHGDGILRIYTNAYTDATSFKTAMAGVLLYYELAEPIVTEHQEPFNLDFQVTNGGQEQAMATKPTTPFKAEIAYGFNASAKIKENANEIASLKATIAQLQAALASMVNANVEDYE